MAGQPLAYGTGCVQGEEGCGERRISWRHATNWKLSRNLAGAVRCGGDSARGVRLEHEDGDGRRNTACLADDDGDYDDAAERDDEHADNADATADDEHTDDEHYALGA
jgi:hypothetical protein